MEILEDLFFIERGYLNANHFVYRSPSPILIDTGYLSDFSETERCITALGVNPDDVALIVNTHTHCDHIGGNHIIQQRSGCDIALHTVGKHFIEARDDWATWWRYFHQEAQFFDGTKPLEDGQVIHIGPHAFKVIYTPGHASDGIVLYNAEEKLLISSDTLWERDMAVVNPRVEGSTALFRMRESLRRLETLKVKMVYPGHGKPFANIKKALAQAGARIERFLQEPHRVGTDLIKKIMVYTLLMRRQIEEDAFFPRLMKTHWFREYVDLYFEGRYEATYERAMASFLKRGIVQCRSGKLVTTVKP